MNIINKLFFSLLAVSILFGCKDNEVKPPNPPVVVVTGIPADGFIFFSSETTAKMFVILSDSPWEITKDAEWIDVEPATGNAGTVTVNLSVSINEGDARSGEVTITANSGTTTEPVTWSDKFTVNQQRKTATNLYLSEFEEVSIAGESYLKGVISFTSGDFVIIHGIDESKIENAYNRDFFDYDPATGELVFTGETGEWEVFYSENFNHFWIIKKWAPSVPTDYWWIFGGGFNSAFESFTGGAWRVTPADIGFMKPIGGGRHQVHGWLNEAFSLAIMVCVPYYPVGIESFTGDIEGMRLFQETPDTNTHFQGYALYGYTPGYFRITWDENTKILNLERLFSFE